MAFCYQKISWQLSKEKLLKMLAEGGDNYTALEFKMCIEEGAVTNYYMGLVGGTPESGEASETLTGQTKVCPVPPDCN